MPPKKPPPKSKSKDKKGKKGKGKKKEKKEKKKRPVPKKYIGIEFDGENIYYKNRDELEFIAETMQNALEKERADRIRFQMERDMFAELNKLYLLRLKEFRVKREWQTSVVNKMHQDVADQKVIKAQEGKHFGYEGQLLLSSSQMRDEIRRKKLKEKVKNFWKFCFIDGDNYDEKLFNLYTQIDERILEKKSKLEADTNYIEEIHNSRKEFAQILHKVVKNSEKELEIMGFFEISSEKERYNEAITHFSNNFEWIFLTAKNYYLDQVHNMLSLIVSMMDHIDEMDMDSRFYDEQERRYAALLDGLEKKLKQLQGNWRRAKKCHDALLHLEIGLKNTYRKIRDSEKEIEDVMQQYKSLTHSVTSLEKDRLLFQKATQKCGCDINPKLKKEIVECVAPVYNPCGCRPKYC